MHIPLFPTHLKNLLCFVFKVDKKKSQAIRIWGLIFKMENVLFWDWQLIDDQNGKKASSGTRMFVWQAGFCSAIVIEIILVWLIRWRLQRWKKLTVVRLRCIIPSRTFDRKCICYRNRNEGITLVFCVSLCVGILWEWNAVRRVSLEKRVWVPCLAMLTSASVFFSILYPLSPSVLTSPVMQYTYR